MFNYRITCCIGLLISSFSCGEKSLKAPFAIKLTDFAPNSGLAEKTVLIKTLHSPQRLEGSRCDIKIAASISGSADSGGSLYNLSLNEGEGAYPEFVVKNGVIIPSNLRSSLAFASYYLFEEISQFWVDNFALDMCAFGKIRIKLDPFTRDLETFPNDVYYLGHGHQFFAINFPRGPERFSIKLNKKIIAHEFFHGVFDYIVFKRTSILYSKGNADDQWNIKGINEGLADYFSYAVTNDANFLAEFSPASAKNRALPVAWRSQHVATATRVKKSKIAGDYYAKGSVLASALYEIGQRTKQNPIILGRQVLAALHTFSVLWANNTWIGRFDYHHLICLILEQAPPDQRATYCSIFRYWFNDVDNYQEISSKCASFYPDP
jgi:hypothetical protein